MRRKDKINVPAIALEGRRLRVDCVNQGLLEVSIGLENEGGGGNKGHGNGDVTNPVQVLDLSQNAISFLNGGAFYFDIFARLEALHLSRNSIAHISASALQGLGHLKLLDLSYNRLRRNQIVLPGSFGPQSTLLVPQLFEDAPNLRALRLGFNPLENEDFYGKTSIQDGEPLLTAPKLEYLDLGSCRLGHVGPKSFIGLEALKVLNLSDNQLISLSPLALDKMESLEVLLLKANPWPCDQRGDMQSLENWLSSKKFHPACPPKKLEKLVQSNSKTSGPQKAKDDHTLLYYYQLLGTNFEEDPLPKVQHLDSDYPDDVEVFDEKATDPFYKQLEEFSNTPTNFSLKSDVIYKLQYCSVVGVSLFWFVLLSFVAGFLMSFLCTFIYFAQPCSIKRCCTNFLGMIQRGNSTTARRRYLNRIKSLSRGENFTSLSECGNAQGEAFSLIDENEDELRSMGLTTPIMHRAAVATMRTETPPPSYAQHLALHAIQTDS
ncbi:transforming growth factor beta activator LRRC32-like [Hetaerina americana]|uniref:transforming growth factor beta activator LRRC32-like n=1 Tax=Hetaerina americana TaxID=62018 RepID=UPI003A7F4EE5